MASATWSQIVERLAHAHEDDVGELAVLLSGEGHSPRSSRATCTWATISAAVRLRTRGWVPVWQKVQFSVQPTWLETQSAPARPTSGMKTRLGLDARREADQPLARAVAG